MKNKKKKKGIDRILVKMRKKKKIIENEMKNSGEEREKKGSKGTADPN